MSRAKWEPHPHPKKQTPLTPKEPPSPSFEENFKIFLRVKPVVNHQPRSDCLRITSSKEVEVLPPYYSTEPDRTYEYEEVFGQSATNLQVFERTMRDPIRNVLAGFNSTVFIYGMTGAGKTYTMFSGERQQEGVVGLTLERLFELMQVEQRCKFQVLLSFFEVYNENINDLLSETAHQLSIMEDPVKGVFINDLKEVSIESASQAKAAILESLDRRSHNATTNNEYSSRSHAILQFTIRQFRPQEKGEVAVSESKLFLIDLAGNEKAGQNESKRFVEGININKSLLTLGKCINILADQKKPAFIPFRDSKLTRILKDSLGGNSKTVMIACVSPEARFYEQTLNTLKYSTKARRIKNKGQAASIKLIHAKQVPYDTVQHRCETEPDPTDQEKLQSLINRLQILLQQKVRVERMRQELKECYFENEAEMGNDGGDGCNQHMKEINELMPKLNRKHNSLENTMEQEVKKFLAEIGKIKDSIYKQEITSYKQKLKEQGKEIEEMRTIINEQRAKLHTISQERLNCSSNNEVHSSSVAHSISHQTLPLEPQSTNKLSTPTISQKVISSNNHILIHESNGKSESKKSMHIDITSTKNSNKQNIHFPNDHKRANTPQSSMHSSKLLAKNDLDKSKPHRKQPEKPTFSITMDSIKLKSPTLRIQTKESQPLLTKESVEFGRDSRESFLGRLIEMDKNMQRFSREQLKAMVEEFDSGSYQVNKTQMSMVNKLKFMAKAHDHSAPKDAIKRDRSLLK